MGFCRIIATLYDDSGNVVGVSFAYTLVDVIPSGSKSPFEISTSHWEGATNYTLVVQGSEDVLPRQDLEISSHKSSQDGDYLTILGEVKNTGTTVAEFVRIIATLYDVDGKVVGVIMTYTSLDEIPAGESSPFEGSTSYFPNFDHYEIQVQGQ